MSILYWITLSINIITCIVPLLILLWSVQERPSKGLTNLIVVILCIFLNGFGNLVIFLSQDANSAMIGAKLSVICKVLLISATSEFLSEYCHFKVRLKEKIVVIIIDIIIIFGVLLTVTLKSFYKSFWLESNNCVPVLRYEPGYCYYIYIALLLVTLLGISFILSSVILNNRDGKEKNKYVCMLIGILLPVAGVLLNKLVTKGRFDTVPLSLMIGSVVFFYGMKKYEIFDLSQNAKEYVLDHSVEAIMVVDSAGNIRYMNEMLKKAEPFLKLHEELPSAYTDLLKEEKREYQISDQYYESFRTELFNQQGYLQGYLIEIRNVTSRYRKINEMNALMEEARLADQTKSTFLARMSHDIRTPIHAVLGMDEMILRETTDETISEYAENIGNAGKTLLSIINDILDFSKIESGELEIVGQRYELKEILENAKRMVQPRIEEKSINFEMIINPDTPRTLFGDANRIQQAMINILTNAAKYTQEGSITARVDYRKREVTANGPEILLIFSVQDTGIGIKSDDLDKLFQSFQRVDEEKNRNIEGTGLGLTITQRLIQKMNGKILVESEYQKGSTFILEIPQTVVDLVGIGYKEEKAKEEKQKHRYREKFHAPEARILIVDDNAVNIKVLQGLLKRTLVQITAVNSGFACLDEIRKTRFDLIFMDHMMPEMDGIETFEQMKTMKTNLNAKTPVIVLTANAIAGAREMYLSKGFQDYLMKPVNSEDLENMMIQYLPAELVELREQ